MFVQEISRQLLASSDSLGVAKPEIVAGPGRGANEAWTSRVQRFLRARFFGRSRGGAKLQRG
jgi:hypothetical protein